MQYTHLCINRQMQVPYAILPIHVPEDFPVLNGARPSAGTVLKMKLHIFFKSFSGIQ